jgi:NitT/TauT family transport system permease protein
MQEIPNTVQELVKEVSPLPSLRINSWFDSIFAGLVKRRLSSLVPFVIVLLLWQLVGADGGRRSIFLPSPLSVLRTLGSLFAEPDFYLDVGWSIYRVSIGFIFAVLVGVPLGFLAGRFQIMASLINPINDFMRYLPVASLIPLCILWVGIGDSNT